MRRGKAIQLAIRAIEKQIQLIAVDANLHDVYKLDGPRFENASEKRKELVEAMNVLAGIEAEKDGE